MYLYLKAISDGRIVYASSTISNLHQPLGIKQARTLKKIFTKCLSLNLIGIDHKNDILYVRRYSYVLKSFNLKGKSATVLESYIDNARFKAWVIASILTKRIFWLNRRNSGLKGKRRKRVLAKGFGTTQRASLPEAKKPGLAIRYMEKFLQVSHGKAHDLKGLCIQHGFIRVEKRYVPLEIKFANKTFYPLNSDIQLVQEQFPELRGRIIIKDHKNEFSSFVRISDDIIPLLKLKRKNLR